MTTRLLTVPDEKEALSRAYVQVIAARAGFTTAVYDFDRDGVDMRIQAGDALRHAIELQLKATATLGSPRQGFFRYRLKRRNYDLLTIDAITPRALVVLDAGRARPVGHGNRRRTRSAALRLLAGSEWRERAVRAGHNYRSHPRATYSTLRASVI